MGGPDPSVPPEFGFDEALEPIIPERALLLDVGTDFRELLIADRFGEERAIGGNQRGRSNYPFESKGGASSESSILGRAIGVRFI